MPAWQRTYATLCAFASAFLLGYLGCDYFRWTRAIYHPTRREWSLASAAGRVPIGFYGQLLWALACGLGGGALGYGAARLWRRPLGAQTLHLLAGWTLGFAAIAIAYFFLAQLAVTLPAFAAGSAAGPAALAALGQRFAAVGFDLEAVLAHTRASVLAGIPLAIGAERQSARPPARGLGALIELCVCGQPVPAAAIEAVLGAAPLGLPVRWGWSRAPGPLVSARMALVPVARQRGRGEHRRTGPSVLVLHDRHDAAAEADAVMPPDTSSETLLRCLPERAGAWLDVGTGSGLVALMAARHGASVVAADVNPRAVAALALAAALNGLAVDAVVSDLMAAVPARRYDVVTFNAPLMFGARHAATWRSSPEGAGLMARFLAALDGTLADDPGAETLVHGQLAHDARPLMARLAPLAPAAWRALSVRYYVEDDHAQGVLWLARRGAEAWSREESLELSLDRPFVDRALLDAAIARQEMPGARRT